jgi:peptidoglycan/LPS O-acetylase OafA/YrhL
VDTPTPPNPLATQTAHSPTVSARSAEAVSRLGVWPERFDLIDAWRGLAALAVVIHHVAHIFIGGPAVMLFFVISGYCIAASADSCQRRGLGFGRFMLRRLRRIYPPYLLSLAFWAVTRLVKWQASGVNDLTHRIDGTPRDPLHWVQNVTLTQWLSLPANPLPSAAENPVLFVAVYWSLCYEEQFYLLTGLMLALTAVIGISVRTMIVVLIGAGLVWNIIFPQICYGVFVEYWALFGLGALVFYRLCRTPEAFHRRLIDGGLLAILAGSAAMRWWPGMNWQIDDAAINAARRAELRLVYEELLIGAGFALALILMRPLNDRIRGLWIYRPLGALGQITFSLYLIHQFNLTFARVVIERVLGLVGLMHTGADGVRAPIHPWFSLTLQIALHIGLASVFWFFCERPFLNRSLLSTAAPSKPAKPGTQTGDRPAADP